MASLLWLESGSCSGESMAMLGASGPGADVPCLLEFLERHEVKLIWHPSLSPESPRQIEPTFERILNDEEELTILCVEGSILNGPNGTGMFDSWNGKPKRDLIRAMCGKAEFVFAMGTCACFGGIPAAPPNPTEATGLQFAQNVPGALLPPEWRSRGGLPVLNLAGCPVDADTMLKTMSWVLSGHPMEVDAQNKPFTVQPCNADVFTKACGRPKVGFNCYGCVTPRFPVSKSLFTPSEPTAPGRPFGGRTGYFADYGVKRLPVDLPVIAVPVVPAGLVPPECLPPAAK